MANISQVIVSLGTEIAPQNQLVMTVASDRLDDVLVAIKNEMATKANGMAYAATVVSSELKEDFAKHLDIQPTTIIQDYQPMNHEQLAMLLRDNGYEVIKK